ncbi:hypothetical protein ACFXAZ_21105 [Streptomyces sp. NPDC059477]|uniref:hypothetical protein n=1 Tax=Streptomyces sp. NPDC059477 TaxID=3346847 RepID=UPI003681793A
MAEPPPTATATQSTLDKHTVESEEASSSEADVVDVVGGVEFARRTRGSVRPEAPT